MSVKMEDIAFIEGRAAWREGKNLDDNPYDTWGSREEHARWLQWSEGWRAACRERTHGIVTNYDPKPIPDRRFDWTATFDNYEPGEPIGHGSTEMDAIADLHADAEFKRS